MPDISSNIQTHDTCMQASPEIDLERKKISALRWESNPQTSQLQCDCSTIELPSPREQGGGGIRYYFFFWDQYQN